MSLGSQGSAAGFVKDPNQEGTGRTRRSQGRYHNVRDQRPRLGEHTAKNLGHEANRGEDVAVYLIGVVKHISSFARDPRFVVLVGLTDHLAGTISQVLRRWSFPLVRSVQQLRDIELAREPNRTGLPRLLRGSLRYAARRFAHEPELEASSLARWRALDLCWMPPISPGWE
jgi:hypothetical protein